MLPLNWSVIKVFKYYTWWTKGVTQDIKLLLLMWPRGHFKQIEEMIR